MAMSNYTFQNHEGREMVATLVGVPGARHVEFACRNSTRLSLGSVSLPVLLRDPLIAGGWCCMLAPSGDVDGCDEKDLVLLDVDLVEELAVWAQASALGHVESVEE
ncbi:hypothetical protein ABID97_001916 [Variovorax sp. OAS795]|uniref:hypothetical protein n=1 Tax=Variovorax sp. OAS795 TaxID=3034231 RepID=UPI003398A6AF